MTIKLSTLVRDRDEDFASLNLLQADNNLSDLANAATGLTNLGITATSGELNTLDGLTANTTELNTLAGLTANTTELNYVDGVTSPLQTQLNGKVETLTDLGLTATSTELNYVDGVTSPIQTQLDNISVTNATLTKSFVSGETSTIALSQAITAGAPVVSVTKEVPQTGVTSNTWDVATSGVNYDRHDTAYATTLTPSTVGFDLSTASYDSVSFSVNSQDTNPFGIAFNSDGTKMYMVGATNDSVYQYTLSTAFDLSTASYDSVSFSVSGQDTTTRDITFNTDGTKMYIVGADNNSVYQYTLSTAFDLSTASYDSVSFSVGSQDDTTTGIAFNSDGTKMYMVGLANSSVHQYTLSTAFDLSTASYDSVSFSVAGQDIVPSGIAFNTDGTKMYMVGFSSDSVYQYTLSTAFDLSTASYDSVSFSVATQDTTPRDIAFNSDGTKMYMVGTTNDSVYQYTTSKEALVLGTGSFASTDVGKTIEGNGGEAILTATDGSYNLVTAFNDTSTIASGDWSMYATVFDATNGIELSGFINNYAISTASYSGNSLNVSAQNSNPYALTFNNDGTKLYVAGSSTEAIEEYNLSTPYDVTSATYVQTASISLQTPNPRGIKFNQDGTKVFLINATDDDLNEYTLSTAFEIGTINYTGALSTTSENSFFVGFDFNANGTKVFMVSSVDQAIYQYSMSTPFDVSTGSYDSVTASLTGSSENPRAIKFFDNGLGLLVLSDAADTIYKYSLSVAYDLSTLSYTGESFDVSNEDTDQNDIAIIPGGVTLFTVGRGTDSIYEYSIQSINQPTAQYTPAVTNTGGQIDSTYWTDINSMTTTQVDGGGQVYYAVSTDGRTTWKVIDDTNGERSIVRNNAGTWEYNSNVTYGLETWVSAAINTELDALQEALSDVGFVDASEWSYDNTSFNISAQESGGTSLAFNNDGTKMYVLGASTDRVYQYSLSTAFDLSTASYDSVSFSVNAQDSAPSGIAFNNDGTKMYILGLASDSVFQYSLSTAFDLSTASYDSVSFSVSGQDIAPDGITFNNDGTKMYIVGDTSNSIYQYSLSTAFDLSTASYDSVSFSAAAQDTTPEEVAFNNDGTKMYIVGITNNSIFQYSLSTAFDLSTASYDSVSFSVAGQDTNPRNIVFNTDGTKMYVLGENTDTVYQYTTLSAVPANRMDQTQLEAVTDANHYTLGNSLDLMIALYLESASLSIPSSGGVSINYDANVKNEGAVLGTDYDFDFPANDVVRITSNATQNLKVRIV